jgi:hypothetical protein
VDSRPKPKKPSNPSSPKTFLFVNQRKSLKFPQNKKIHLVTLFSVHLRVFPFSDQPLKTSNPQKLSESRSIDPVLAISRRPIIKGLRPDLILSATRYL